MSEETKSTEEVKEKEVPESGRIERPTQDFREETIVETYGSLTVTRPYGVVRLPVLDIDAYIPGYLFVREVADQWEEKEWKAIIFFVKKFVSKDGKIIDSKDVSDAIDTRDLNVLKHAAAYTRQNYELTPEKKSS